MCSQDLSTAAPERIRRPLPGASRSWFYVETERAWDIMEARLRCENALDSVAPEVLQSDPAYLASIDASDRFAAVADYNLESLAVASEVLSDGEAQARKTRLKSNIDATGLQSLVKAIEVEAPPPPSTLPSTPPQRGRTRKNTPAKALSSATATPLTLPTEPGAAQATKGVRTPKPRAEPALGLFLTPKTMTTPSPLRHAATSTSSSLQTPSRPPANEKAPTKRSTSRSRILAPKSSASATSPARRSSTNPLSNILNDDDVSDIASTRTMTRPPAPDSYKYRSYGDGPAPGAYPQTSVTQSPGFPVSFQPVQYRGYETQAPPLYSPSLPAGPGAAPGPGPGAGPPPTFNAYPTYRQPPTHPPALPRSASYTYQHASPNHPYDHGHYVGGHGSRDAPRLPLAGPGSGERDTFWSSERPHTTTLPPPPYWPVPTAPPLLTQATQDMPPPPPQFIYQTTTGASHPRMSVPQVLRPLSDPTPFGFHPYRARDGNAQPPARDDPRR